MLLSLSAFGKWAVAAAAIYGWSCWGIPAIFRVAGNPKLTSADRTQVIVLAAICFLPLLVIVWLVSEGHGELSSAQGHGASTTLAVPSSVDPPDRIALDRDRK